MCWEIMRERILLFTILACLGVFLYIFQNYVNTVVGFVILCVCMVVYGLYSIAATKYQKRKLKKHPPIVNENYKPFVSIMIPAHNEESVIRYTVENILKLDYPNYELIIIDDRSTDNTANVIKDLEAKHDRVIALIRDFDAFPGKSAVLNDAFKIAKQERMKVEIISGSFSSHCRSPVPICRTFIIRVDGQPFTKSANISPLWTGA